MAELFIDAERAPKRKAGHIRRQFANIHRSLIDFVNDRSGFDDLFETVDPPGSATQVGR